MKVALVHELLTVRGGAERTLRVLADMFPEAPIYTLLYDESKLGEWFPRPRVIPSKIQKWTSIFGFNHHLYLSRFPDAIEEWDFDEFDLVISSSSAFVHGILTYGKTKHVCYVHSPARYLWDRTHDVLERSRGSAFGFLKRRVLERWFHELRQWDVEVSDRPQVLLAASRAVQRRIELYWRRESTVVYPPVDLSRFQSVPLGTAASRPTRGDRANYPYVIASTLAPYKRIDIAIEACNALQRPLVIAGEGPDRKRLQKIAGPTVEFLGYIPDSQMPSFLAQARVFLFPGEEDFGIAPIEAMAAGTPVIAYRGGGARETISEGKTGEFFDEPTTRSLQQTMQKFEQRSYSIEVCQGQALNFSAERMRCAVEGVVVDLMSNAPLSPLRSTRSCTIPPPCKHS